MQSANQQNNKKSVLFAQKLVEFNEPENCEALTAIDLSRSPSRSPLLSARRKLGPLGDTRLDETGQELSSISPNQTSSKEGKLKGKVKFLVKNRSYIADARHFSPFSPVITAIRSNEWRQGNSLAEAEAEEAIAVIEIVDENPRDIQLFFDCLTKQNADSITANNLDDLLRLTAKYQVNGIRPLCEQFIAREVRKTQKIQKFIDFLKIAADYNLCRSVLEVLIDKIARFDRSRLNELHLTRHFSPLIYGAIISTNMNMSRIKQLEDTNGHVFDFDDTNNRFVYKNATCSRCSKELNECMLCDGCKMAFCLDDYAQVLCGSNFGRQMLTRLREHPVDLDPLDSEHY